MDTITGATRILGLTDEQTTCDRCGRLELHGTVILGDADDTEVARVGTTCATTILGRKVTRRTAVSVETARRGTALRAIDLIHNATTTTDLRRLREGLADLREVMSRPDETVAWYEGLRAQMDLGDLAAAGQLA